jgi:aminopeptidase N
MVIPLALGLVGKDGRDLPLTLQDGRTIERGVLTVTKPAEIFIFTGIDERPVLSLNRAFSAPIKLTANISPADLGFLAAYDSDPFNRWQAVQALAMRILLADVRKTRPDASREDLIAAMDEILEDARLEPAFIAQSLSLPSDGDIARELGSDIDPDAVFQARQGLRAAIGKRLAGTLAETYERMSDSGPYSPDAISAGRRYLKNTCLDLLAADHSAEGIARAAKQYRAAGNMTDRMAALGTLSLYDVPQRTEALDDFYQRYASDPLIVDKWFSLQAHIPEPATLERVRSLTAHPAFSLANPNRVRSLIGAFAHGNPTQFNRSDGAAYEFIAGTVLALDEMNPQVAARLLSAFRTWRTMEATRRIRAEAALRQVAAAPNLSRDVNDIVQRSLADSTEATASA